MGDARWVRSAPPYVWRLPATGGSYDIGVDVPLLSVGYLAVVGVTAGKGVAGAGKASALEGESKEPSKVSI